MNNIKHSFGVNQFLIFLILIYFYKFNLFYQFFELVYLKIVGIYVNFRLENVYIFNI